ncbi:Outer membrane protein C [Serratia marcescens]|nr:Outer membrane protein C [Serratia marcescens]
MKLRVLSLMVPALLVAGTAGAAEIYNKDGNKLDLYGKVDGLHYFLWGSDLFCTLGEVGEFRREASENKDSGRLI